MMQKQKELYSVSMIRVILAYIGNYKSIDNENDEIKMSEYIAAIGIVTSMSYIACIGFFFGRYVFRSM